MTQLFRTRGTSDEGSSTRGLHRTSALGGTSNIILYVCMYIYIYTCSVDYTLLYLAYYVLYIRYSWPLLALPACDLKPPQTGSWEVFSAFWGSACVDKESTWHPMANAEGPKSRTSEGRRRTLLEDVGALLQKVTLQSLRKCHDFESPKP